MKTGKLLVMLTGGYFGIWALAGFAVSSLNLNIDDKVLPAYFITGIILSVICFYPPTAIAYLFHKQSGKNRWYYAGLLTVLMGVGFCSWIIVDGYNGGGNGYDGLKYLLGVPCGYVCSLVIIIMEAASKIQKTSTRAFGLTTLGAALGWVAVFLAPDLLNVKLPSNYELLIRIGIPFIILTALGYVTLTSASLLGPKTR